MGEEKTKTKLDKRKQVGEEKTKTKLDRRKKVGEEKTKTKQDRRKQCAALFVLAFTFYMFSNYTAKSIEERVVEEL